MPYVTCTKAIDDMPQYPSGALIAFVPGQPQYIHESVRHYYAGNPDFTVTDTNPELDSALQITSTGLTVAGQTPTPAQAAAVRFGIGARNDVLLTEWQSELVSNNALETGGPFYDSFGQLFRLTSGRIIHVFRRGTEHVSASNVMIQYFESSSGGWSTPSILFSGGNLDDFYDPRGIGGCVTESGALLIVLSDYGVSAQRNKIRVLRSTDDGVSFSQSEDYTDSDFTGILTYGPAVQANGVIYQPYYSGTRVVKLLKSVDDGVTWSIGPVVFPVSAYTTSECTIAYIGNSNWVAACRSWESGGAQPIRLARSTDNGATWSVLGSAPITAGNHVSPLFVPWRNNSGVQMLSLYYTDRAVSKTKVSDIPFVIAAGGAILTNGFRPFEYVANYGLGYPAAIVADDGAHLLVSYKETTSNNSQSVYSVRYCGNSPSYDSGYFAVALSQTYAKFGVIGQQSEGKAKRYQLTWAATNADLATEYDASGDASICVKPNNSVEIYTDATYTFNGKAPAPVAQTGGYYRLRLWQ